jgi:hypothetical protein
VFGHFCSALSLKLVDYCREELLMIVVRNVFRLKFGKAREALALIKEGVAIQKRAGATFSERVLTDVTGPFYTVVLELTVASLSALETEAPRLMGDKDFQGILGFEWMQGVPSRGWPGGNCLRQQGSLISPFPFPLRGKPGRAGAPHAGQRRPGSPHKRGFKPLR